MRGDDYPLSEIHGLRTTCTIDTLNSSGLALIDIDDEGVLPARRYGIAPAVVIRIQYVSITIPFRKRHRGATRPKYSHGASANRRRWIWARTGDWHDFNACPSLNPTNFGRAPAHAYRVVTEIGLGGGA